MGVVAWFFSLARLCSTPAYLQRSTGDAYGYVLTQTVKSVVEVSESTLYPVLRRLQKDGALTVYDEPFNGRNRRYYRLTDIGRERLARYVSEWETFQEGVDKLLLGGIGDDQE